MEWLNLFYKDSTHDLEVTNEFLKPRRRLDEEDIFAENEDKNRRRKDKIERSNFYKVKEIKFSENLCRR